MDSRLFLLVRSNDEVASAEYFLCSWSLFPLVYIPLMYNKDFCIDNRCIGALNGNWSLFFQLYSHWYWINWLLTRIYIHSFYARQFFLSYFIMCNWYIVFSSFSSARPFASSIWSAGCLFMNEYRESVCLAHAYRLLETLDLGSPSEYYSWRNMKHSVYPLPMGTKNQFSITLWTFLWLKELYRSAT